MEQMYEDIINFITDNSYDKKTVNPNEQERNNHIKNLVEKIKELLQAKEGKEEILKEIKKINEKYHLRIDTLFKENDINEQELNIALDLYYGKEITKNKIANLREYITQIHIINKLKNKQENLKIIQCLLEKQFDKLENEITKKRSIYEKIFKRKKIKNTINNNKEEIKKQIDEIIIKIIPKKEIIESLKALKKEIDTTDKTNIKAIKEKLMKQLTNIKFYLVKLVNQEKTNKRETVDLPQEIISLHSTNPKSFLLNMEIDKKNNKNKYDLLIKVLLTLKLLTMINTKGQEIIEKIEEYENKKTR